MMSTWKMPMKNLCLLLMIILFWWMKVLLKSKLPSMELLFLSHNMNTIAGVANNLHTSTSTSMLALWRLSRSKHLRNDKQSILGLVKWKLLMTMRTTPSNHNCKQLVLVATKMPGFHSILDTHSHSRINNSFDLNS